MCNCSLSFVLFELGTASSYSTTVRLTTQATFLMSLKTGPETVTSLHSHTFIKSLGTWGNLADAEESAVPTSMASWPFGMLWRLSRPQKVLPCFPQASLSQYWDSNGQQFHNLVPHTRFSLFSHPEVRTIMACHGTQIKNRLPLYLAICRHSLGSLWLVLETCVA